jgi:hypothetical protein
MRMEWMLLNVRYPAQLQLRIVPLKKFQRQQMVDVVDVHMSYYMNQVYLCDAVNFHQMELSVNYNIVVAAGNDYSKDAADFPDIHQIFDDDDDYVDLQVLEL